MNRFWSEGVGLSKTGGECWIEVVSAETRRVSVTGGVCEGLGFFKWR